MHITNIYTLVCLNTYIYLSSKILIIYRKYWTFQCINVIKCGPKIIEILNSIKSEVIGVRKCRMDASFEMLFFMEIFVWTNFNPLRGGGIYYTPPKFNIDSHWKLLIKFNFYNFGVKELKNGFFLFQYKTFKISGGNSAWHKRNFLPLEGLKGN